jgi:hypothetical protein
MAPDSQGFRPGQSPAFAATLREKRRGDPRFRFLRSGKTAAGRYFAARLGFERQQLACLPRAAAAAAGPREAASPRPGSPAEVHASVGEMMRNIHELSALGVFPPQDGSSRPHEQDPWQAGLRRAPRVAPSQGSSSIGGGSFPAPSKRSSPAAPAGKKGGRRRRRAGRPSPEGPPPPGEGGKAFTGAGKPSRPPPPITAPTYGTRSRPG